MELDKWIKQKADTIKSLMVIGSIAFFVINWYIDTQYKAERVDENVIEIQEEIEKIKTESEKCSDKIGEIEFNLGLLEKEVEHNYENQN